MQAAIDGADAALMLRRARRSPLFGLQDGLQAVHIDRTAVQRLLPHRGSFLFVDRVQAVDLAGRLIGERRLAEDDPIFADHFPGQPLYPGVLLVEVAGQFALCLAALQALGRLDVPADAVPLPVRLVRVQDASFLAPARPGDVLTVRASILDTGGLTLTALAQVSRGQTVLCVTLLEVLIGDAP